MANTALRLVPELDKTPSYGFVAPHKPQEYSPKDFPETSPLGIFEEPLQNLEQAGRRVVGLVLDLPARTMDLVFGNELWP